MSSGRAFQSSTTDGIKEFLYIEVLQAMPWRSLARRLYAHIVIRRDVQRNRRKIDTCHMSEMIFYSTVTSHYVPPADVVTASLHSNSADGRHNLQAAS